MPIAVIAGASGLTGSHCLQHLLTDGVYERVIALVRRPSSRTEERLEQLDIAELENVSLPEHCDVFCSVGTTIRKAGSREAFREVDHHLPVVLARRAALAGARHFAIVSSVDSNPSSPNFYLRTKGQMESDIAALGLGSVSIFRPSVLLGPRLDFRPGERIGAAVGLALRFTLNGRLRRYRPIHARTVALAMIAAARTARPGTTAYHFDEICSLAGIIRTSGRPG